MKWHFTMFARNVGHILTPNEKCDCENVSEKEKKAREHLLLVEKGTNQLAFRWPSERAGV